MKIVQFKIGSFGGAERFFFKLIKAFDEAGIEQHIIHNEHPRMREEAIKTGLPRTEIPFPKKALAIRSRLKLRQVVAREKPDIFFCWASNAGRRAFKRPGMTTVARLGGYANPKRFRGCQHLICNTPDLVRHCLEGGWKENRVHMISNFGELDPMPAIDRATIDVQDDQVLLLSLGRLEDIKGFQDVISALPNLPENIVYAIAGEGPMEQDLRSLAEQLGVAHRVKFLGWRGDQAALLAASDICMVPSHHEPLGNVILEAWCLKVPVIAARSEGPSWLIEDGVTGLLHDVGDVIALTELLRSPTNSAVLNQISIGGFTQWERNFSKSKIVETYIDRFKGKFVV